MEQPLYKQIMNEIKKQIDIEQIKIGDKLPTELELAKNHQVSRITAKRVLTELENEGLIVRKRGAGSFLIDPLQMKETGPAAKNILLLVPFFEDENFTDYANSIAKGIEGSGYSFFIQQVESFQEVTLAEFQKQYAGVIYYPSSSTHLLPFFYELYLDGFPVMFIDKKLEGIDYPVVMADNVQGSYTATKYLLENGYRDILFVASGLTSNKVRDRYFGYIKAMHEAEISNTHFFEYHESDNEEEKFELLERMAQYIYSRDISAILAENDLLAVMLIQKLKSFELFVPNDVSVLGFDDIIAAQLLSPSVTTVVSPLAQIGRKAAELLLQQISTGEIVEGDYFLPVDLVVRDSTKELVEN